jgi:hypothetical protein
MKHHHRLIVLLLCLIAWPTAQATPPWLPAKPKVACTFDPTTGLVVCPPTVSCVPPLLWHTDRCECPDGSTPIETPDGPICSGMTCRITLTYSATNPSDSTVSPRDDPGCDAAGAELAIAAALAKSLGLRMP